MKSQITAIKIWSETSPRVFTNSARTLTGQKIKLTDVLLSLLDEESSKEKLL